MSIISEREKNFKSFKESIASLINNSVCPRCYKKFNRFQFKHKHYKKLEDIDFTKNIYTFSNTLYIKHKPCDSAISISFNDQFIISLLYITYSYSLNKEHYVDVRSTMNKNEDGIYFDNSVCYNRKYYNIDSEKPLCMKKVNKYIGNLIFI